MAEEKKSSAAQQKIIANYEKQRDEFKAQGYTEKSEVVSVVKANIMVFVTSFPIMILAVVLWILADRGTMMLDIKSWCLMLAVFFVTVFIHEILHGAGWCLGSKYGWKSIHIGMMWESLTPYCHCKEPLSPGKYLLGCLIPGLILGVGVYVTAFITGSAFLLWISLLNIISAGGDLLIAWYGRKYKTGYMLDHPTECGFIIFENKK